MYIGQAAIPRECNAAPAPGLAPAPVVQAVPKSAAEQMPGAGHRLEWIDQAPCDRLLGLDLVHASRDEAARALVTAAAFGHRLTLQFVNAHCVNTLQRDPAYRAALAQADVLFPDGAGMKLAGRLAGISLGDNLNGTDLFPVLCRKAAAMAVPVYLLGGRPGIAAAAGAEMRAQCPGLVVAGARDGFWTAAEEDALIAEINASGARIVLVGLGVPLQEKWIARVRGRLVAPVVAGVGGLFDYYAGAVARAPLAWRRLGCEWLWRLNQEPARLFARYVLGNPRFVLTALAHGWRAHPLSQWRSRAVKRGCELVAALLALVALLPLFLLVALAIRAEDGGPVFFRQSRIGRSGRAFSIWKFRSMVIDADRQIDTVLAQSDRDGACFKMKVDPRVTRVGRLLRRLSIDELPQLFNILSGDMSVVGPRPALPREVLAYDAPARRRLSGKPGLTCTWQVSGRANVTFDEQVAMDIRYLDRRSLLGDLALIARTVPAVIVGHGAY